MIKLLSPLLLLLFLSGCDNKPIDQKEYTIQRLDNIPELRGCIYIKMDNGNLKVIRCQNPSTTTVQWTTGGKNTNTYNTTTLD